MVKRDEPPPKKHVYKAGCPDYAKSMQAGRAATLSKRFDAAFEAFDDAVRAKPVDARARSERGYAYLLAGQADRASADFYDAIALTKDRALLAQIWFNQGTALAKDADASRIAFVIAEGLGSKAATAKLGSASRCTAVFSTAKDGDAPIAKGWDELAHERAIVNCTTPALEAADATARTLACRGCGYGSKDEGDACDDDKGPWIVPSGYMHFHTHTFFIAPLGGGSFFYENEIDAPGAPAYRVENGLLALEGSYATGDTLLFHSGGSDLVYGKFATNGDDPFVTTGGGWSDEMDFEGTWKTDSGTGCAPDMHAEVELGSANAAQMAGTPMIPSRTGPRITTWFDIATRKSVFTLTVYEGPVTATIDRRVAHVHGGACDRDVPLP
jgi:hypothetical protein